MQVKGLREQVEVCIGTSTLGFGKGLYIYGEAEQVVRKDTVICDYAPGRFDIRVMGDKVVHFGFYRLDKNVVFDGKVMTLQRALEVEGAREGGGGGRGEVNRHLWADTLFFTSG